MCLVERFLPYLMNGDLAILRVERTVTMAMRMQTMIPTTVLSRHYPGICSKCIKLPALWN